MSEVIESHGAHIPLIGLGTWDLRGKSCARMVEEAQTGKTRMQALADRVAGAFVPIVVVLAVLTFAGWLIAGAETARAWSTMIAVLVVACPCALPLTRICSGQGVPLP